MPYISANGKSLHYADSNQTSSSSDSEPSPPSSLTIVCIHGLGSSQNYYFPILPYLTPKYRVLALDTYGAGRSRYTGGEHSLRTLAQDVLGVMDGLGVEKAVVVGHSMGGMLASYLGSTAPERVLGLVAIGPVNPSPSMAPIFEQRIKTVDEVNSTEPLADTIPRTATAANSSSLTKAFIRELILNSQPEGYAANCHFIATATPPDYAAVRAPFLLIAGEEDKSAPLEGSRFIYEHVGSEHKRMEVLEGCGHWHCVEAPERVGTLVAGFCEGLTD